MKKVIFAAFLAVSSVPVLADEAKGLADCQKNVSKVYEHTVEVAQSFGISERQARKLTKANMPEDYIRQVYPDVDIAACAAVVK